MQSAQMLGWVTPGPGPSCFYPSVFLMLTWGAQLRKVSTPWTGHSFAA